MSVAIAGAASRIEPQFTNGIEPVVRDVVREALDAAAFSLADIEMVITVASDALDGMMVPVRAELAGALGKSYLNVPSSAGHALSAAVAAIESGDAGSVLVVGWGAASKLGEVDPRSNQFDPFYMRPVGATPQVVASLQSQVLMAAGLTSESKIDAFRNRMREVVWKDAGSENVTTSNFCDGVAALVLKRVGEDEVGLIVSDYATSSRSHAPLDAKLDPANWVREAVSGFSGMRPEEVLANGFIEVSGTSSCAEIRAICGAIDAGLVACKVEEANAKGGGAFCWFGPATGLRVLAELCRDQSRETNTTGLFVDLAGPLGQLVTAILIERRGAQ